MKLGKIPMTSQSLLFLILLVLLGPICCHGFLDSILASLHNAITPYKPAEDQPRTHYFAKSPQNNYLTSYFKTTRKCFGDLGCVEDNDGWFNVAYRPWSILPYDRERINTSFIFYNRNRTFDPVPVRLHKESLISHGFDASKPTKFIVHGYIENGLAYWTKELARALLYAGDFNIFVVNWSDGARPPYIQATANTRLVGLEIAFMVKYLVEKLEVDIDNVHLIGHSLGAHICGYAGEKMNGTVGRITGLDPAGPNFQFMPNMVRLDPSDARFVDVIHTDGMPMGGFGSRQLCGHVDFYMNGGFNQPGCAEGNPAATFDELGSLSLAALEIVFCNHHRSVYLFIEAVRNSCKFVGHKCNDFQKYVQGKCASCGEDGSQCSVMGLEAIDYKPKGMNVQYQISTADKAPYCERHFLVQIKLAFPEGSDDWVRGDLKLSLYGSRKSLIDASLIPTIDVKFNRNDMQTFMVATNEDLEQIKQVKLEWKSDGGILSKFHYNCLLSLGCNYKLFVEKIELSDMDQMQMGNAINPKQNLAIEPTAFCNENFTGIRSGSSGIFKKQC